MRFLIVRSIHAIVRYDLQRNASVVVFQPDYLAPQGLHHVLGRYERVASLRVFGLFGHFVKHLVRL